MNTPFGNATYSNIGHALRAVLEQSGGDDQRRNSGLCEKPTSEHPKIAAFVAELPDESDSQQGGYASILDGLDTEKFAVDHSTQNESCNGAVERSTQNVLHDGAVDHST